MGAAPPPPDAGPPAAPGAGAAALHASRRISTPARSSISVPAARRRTAPEAADVRTTSERVSLSPCLIADQVSPRCASTLPVADITSNTWVVLAAAGSGAPAAATAVGGASSAVFSGDSNSRRDTRVATTTIAIAISAIATVRMVARALHVRCARPASAGNVSTNFVPVAGRAFDGDRAAVVLDDAVDEGQPQPGTDAIARAWS